MSYINKEQAIDLMESMIADKGVAFNPHKLAMALKDMESVEIPEAKDTDLISRQAAIEALTGWETDPTDEEIVHTLKALPPVEPKPVMTEEVREAIMRLTMCAREACSICKYEKTCGFDKQVEMATKNMNTIIDAFTERPKGEWIEEDKINHKYHIYHICSECGLGRFNWGEDNYCPNCGADMRGADDE